MENIITFVTFAVGGEEERGEIELDLSDSNLHSISIQGCSTCGVTGYWANVGYLRPTDAPNIGHISAIKFPDGQSVELTDYYACGNGEASDFIDSVIPILSPILEANGLLVETYSNGDSGDVTGRNPISPGIDRTFEFDMNEDENVYLVNAGDINADDTIILNINVPQSVGAFYIKTDELNTFVLDSSYYSARTNTVTLHLYTGLTNNFEVEAIRMGFPSDGGDLQRAPTKLIRILSY